MLPYFLTHIPPAGICYVLWSIDPGAFTHSFIRTLLLSGSQASPLPWRLCGSRPPDGIRSRTYQWRARCRARRPLGIGTSVLLVGLRHLCRRASAHPLCGRCGMRTWEFRHPDGTRSRTYLLERCSQYFPIKRASLLRACLTAAQRASLHVRCGMVVVSWRLDLIWDLEFLGS